MEIERFNKYVKDTIESKVQPFELQFYPIVDFDGGYPLAYRTKTKILSIIVGTMEEGGYTYVSDTKDSGKELFLHMLNRLIRTINAFEKNHRNIEYLSIRCPSELVGKMDFYKEIKKVLDANKGFPKSKLCIEFPSNLLAQNDEQAKTAILDVKALKLKTCIKNCGEKEFPLAKMAKITPDFVVLDSSATMMAGDRNKPRLLSSLVAYIKSMGIEVIAEGEDRYRKIMRGTECIGFIQTDREPLSLEEALNQKEEEY